MDGHVTARKTGRHRGPAWRWRGWAVRGEVPARTVGRHAANEDTPTDVLPLVNMAAPGYRSAMVLVPEQTQTADGVALALILQR